MYLCKQYAKTNHYEKYLTLIIVLLFTVVQGVWAQTDFGNVPDTVDPNDATITKMGHLTMTMGKEVVVDPQTQQVDTIIRVKKVERDTETGNGECNICSGRKLTR